MSSLSLRDLNCFALIKHPEVLEPSGADTTRERPGDLEEMETK